MTTDAFGNTVLVTEPDYSGGRQYQKTYYQYNKLDQLLLVSMPRGGKTATACAVPTSTCQSRSFTYDSSTLKLMTERHPETGTTTYAYTQATAQDAYLLAGKLDAKNQRTEYSHDAYYRPTQVVFKNPVPAGSWTEDVCQRVSCQYDTYPAGVGTVVGNSWGRLAASRVGPGGTSAVCKIPVTQNDGSQINQGFLQVYGYTNTGQVSLKRLIFTQTQTAVGGAAKVAVYPWDTTYSFDDEGHQTGIVYPNGWNFQIGLDALKRPYSFTLAGAQPTLVNIQSVTYNAADQMTQMRRQDIAGAAYTDNRTYNMFNQVTQIQG